MEINLAFRGQRLFMNVYQRLFKIRFLAHCYVMAMISGNGRWREAFTVMIPTVYPHM